MELTTFYSDILAHIFYFVDCPEILSRVNRRFNRITKQYKKYLRTGMVSTCQRGDIRLFDLIKGKAVPDYLYYLIKYAPLSMVKFYLGTVYLNRNTNAGHLMHKYTKHAEMASEFNRPDLLEHFSDLINRYAYADSCNIPTMDTDQSHISRKLFNIVNVNGREINLGGVNKITRTREKELYITCTNNILRHALSHNSIKLLEHVAEFISISYDVHNVFVNPITHAMYVSGIQESTLDWLRYQDYSFVETQIEDLDVTNSMYYVAIKNNQPLHVLEWLQRNNCPKVFDPFGCIIAQAVRNKYPVKVLKWLEEAGFTFHINKLTITAIKHKLDLDVLEYITDRNEADELQFVGILYQVSTIWSTTNKEYCSRLLDWLDTKSWFDKRVGKHVINARYNFPVNFLVYLITERKYKITDKQQLFALSVNTDIISSRYSDSDIEWFKQVGLL